jgi:hypothetical protein
MKTIMPLKQNIIPIKRVKDLLSQWEILQGECSKKTCQAGLEIDKVGV